MKKKLLAVIYFALVSFVINAQSFEGKMTIKIEYEEVPEEYEAYISMFPNESQLYVKGKKTRVEQNSMAGSNVTIMDSETGKGIILVNALGKKTAYEMTTADTKKGDDKKPVITYVDETKEIAGYKCKKAELKFEGDDEVTVVWYTEEITDVYNQQYSGYGIKGAVMEYTVSANGMVMTMTVASISKETVSDDKFVIPEGYELKPYSDMMNGMSVED